MKTIKGYELRERIGAGGFGAVYKAYQTTVGREVAVKVILPERANQPDFIRRFESEAQIVARLEHPHIVPLYDYWRDPDGAYLVMRWLRGGSVRDALEKGAFDLPAVVLLLDQIAGALAFAHRNGVVHRDIKPGNILLDEDGNAYVTDFGIAKDLTLTAQKTQSDVIMGSLDYISPEQARSEPITARTDLYSLGVTLYEIICGHHPFENMSSIERLYKHINEPLPEITSLEPGVNAAVNRVIQKATAKNPDHRYPDALAFAADFREAAGIKSASASPVEVLTLREQEILGLIVAGLANKEIAQRLTLTIGTVKWHVNQIYGKLGVRSRVQAIVRARELHLITRPGEERATLIAPTDDFDPPNPYKGLLPFQSADTQDFFGREKVTARLIRRLAETGDFSRFLAIVGPSGSGKSSLAKAGLIPALWRGELPGSERWFVVEMIPGAHPLDELEVALTRVAANQAGNLNEQLRRDNRGLVRSAGLILPNDGLPNNGTDLVLVIDQFEEVFTLVGDEAERSHFLDLLYRVVVEPHSRVRVVITLRADFYDRPLNYAQFGEMVRSRLETIMPLSVEELERAIVQPAERVGVSFEPGLVAAIIGDVNYQPGALPLLQYALTELFENRQGRLLTREAYQSIGGTVGALTRRAEEVYLSLTEEERELSRQIFLRLVTLGEGVEDTRRRVTRSELKALTGDVDTLDEVLEAFAGYRLFSLDTDPGTRTPTVEIAHEALLREWERLRSWLAESRDDIRTQRQLAHTAEEWRGARQDASFLARGSRLLQFEAWAEATHMTLTTPERTFLEASITHRSDEMQAEAKRKAREERLERRSRTFLHGLMVVFAVATVIAVGLALFALDRESQAQTARVDALNAQATSEANFARAEQQRLYLTANEAMDRGEGGNVGLALALRSLQHGYSPGAEAALMRASRQGMFVLELTGFTFDVFSVRYSPDGSLIAASSEGGVRIYDAATGTEQHFLPEAAAIVSHAEFTPDGASLLTIAQTGIARVYDVAAWRETHAFEVEEFVNLVGFSNDGSRVVLGGETLEVWETRTWERLARYEREMDDATYRLGILFGDGSGDRFFTRRENRIVIEDSASGDRVCVPLEADVPIDTMIWWSDTDRLLMIAPADPIDGAYRAYIYNYETCSLLSTIAQPDYRFWNADYDPIHDQLVTIDSNMAVVRWQMATGHELARYHVPINAYSMDISPDGTRLVLADIPTAHVVDLAFPSQPISISTELAGNTDFPRWAPDGETLFIGGFGRGGHYALRDSAPPLRLFEQPLRIFDLSPDGRFMGAALETADENHYPILWIDVATGETIRTFEGFTQLANVVDISRDGTRIASGSFDLTARIWDIATGDTLHVLEGHEGVISSVSFSPDGTRLATSSSDTTVRLWDTATGELIRIIDVGAPVPFVSYSPDGLLIGATSGDGSAYLYDAATGEERLRLVGHTDIVWAVNFSPDSRLAVTASLDGSARVWDIHSGELLRTLTSGSGNALYSAEFSPDGHTVLTGVEFDHRVYLYTVDLEAVIAAMCAQPLLNLSAQQRTQYGILDDDPVCPSV
ncbi:MAG: protein kinase [Chloroflexi bacterium]|nr:protein kinase [Chloroflexota bacterium]